MKRLLLPLFAVTAVTMLAGCCNMDQLGCGTCTKFMPTSCRLQLQGCSRFKCSTCNTTGYDSNYNYAGWY